MGVTGAHFVIHGLGHIINVKRPTLAGRRNICVEEKLVEHIPQLLFHICRGAALQCFDQLEDLF